MTLNPFVAPLKGTHTDRQGPRLLAALLVGEGTGPVCPGNGPWCHLPHCPRRAGDHRPRWFYSRRGLVPACQRAVSSFQIRVWAPRGGGDSGPEPGSLCFPSSPSCPTSGKGLPEGHQKVTFYHNPRPHPSQGLGCTFRGHQRMSLAFFFITAEISRNFRPRAKTSMGGGGVGESAQCLRARRSKMRTSFLSVSDTDTPFLNGRA